MKRLWLGVAVLAMLAAGAAVPPTRGQGQAMGAGAIKTDAKDLTGTWQGTLHAGRDLRTEIKIAKGEDGKYKAQFYSIDQPGPPINVPLVTLQGTDVKFAITMINGSYEGSLSADGKTIDGHWTQGPNPLPLKLNRVTEETAWEIPKPPPPPKPMAADADPSFEVATIKPSDPERRGRGFRTQGRNFTTINTTLSNLIEFAYGLQSKQIVDGPEWMYQDKFDLSAVPDGEGQPNAAQWKTMIKKVLAERFQLKFHNDQRELSVFVLTVAKTGPKLTKNDTGGPLPSMFFRPAPGGMMLPARNATMADFAGVMQSAVFDRPVVDQTGLTGRYDFDLTWAPDESQFSSMPLPPAAQAANPPPSLFTALQEQAGLKLEAAKAPTEVMVIDKAEKPSAN